MKKDLLNIIEESLINEVKRAIINESEEKKDYYHITCEGEPVETFESKEIAMKHLDIYKKNHPDKEFIIEKANYKSPSELIDKLDEMSEELEENKKENPMKKIEVSSLAEAIMMAKNKNQKNIKVNGESFDVNEMWKKLEEDESDVKEGSAFVLAADKARDAGKKEFEFPKGSGKMHKVTLRKNIETKEGKMGSCNECGGMMNEEGDCNECGKGKMEESKKTTEGKKLYYHVLEDGGYGRIGHQGYYDTEAEAQKRANELSDMFPRSSFYVEAYPTKKEPVTVTMEESKKTTLRLTESELVSLIKKMVNESVPGLEVTKKAQSGSKKENDSNLKEVGEKLKKASSFDGNDNPEFPKQIGKGEKMAVNPTEKQEEYIEDVMRGGTMINLEYDVEPSEGFKNRLKMALEGDSKMGNSQEAANVIKSDTGKNLLKSANRKKEKEKDQIEVSWGHRTKEPQKVKVVKESKTNKMSSILEEEIKRMKAILGYDDATQ
jgi:hypothetical protein